ncbi:BnaA08g04680D [Brassica napus]|uniref:BnaA08g04680D protein n=1 Tax=Brassica napus TaxID=3708 RepID=A0A078IG11_BRANA|nr:BnaA08g04680D [Brassica napus]
MFLEAIITSNCAPLLSLMALVKTNVDLPDIFRQDRSIHTIYNDENESIQRVMVTIQLDRSTTVCRVFDKVA